MRLAIGIMLIVIGGIFSIALFVVEPFLGIILAVLIAGPGVYLLYKEKKEDDERGKKVSEQFNSQIKKMDEYDAWFKKNYPNARRIIHRSFPMDWNEMDMAGIDTTKEVLIIGKYEIKFNDIVDVRLETKTTHSVSTHTEKENPLGRAVVGGIVAGGVGAVIGAASAKEKTTSTINDKTEATGVVIYLANNPYRSTYEYRASSDFDNTQVYDAVVSIIKSKK